MRGGKEGTVEKVPGGYKYAVPDGWTFHCPLCPRDVVLKAGDECYVKDLDSSHVYCKRHFPFLGPKRADGPEQEEKPVEARPRVHHRRESYEQMVL